MAAEGAAIIGVDICAPVESVNYPMATEEDLAETARLVEAHDVRAFVQRADTRDRPSLQAALDAGLAELGGLDIVIANAGIASYAPFHEISMEAWQEMLDINLTGVWNTCVVARDALIESQGGSIVITSSAAVLKPPANLVHYTAAKHGTVGVMRSLAKELAPEMIRVNSIHPTQVDTPMVMNDEVFKMFRPELQSPGREDIVDPSTEMNLMPIPWVGVEDVSDAVIFLASDESRYITGVMLPIDAGLQLK
jgi:SDR family mycofactocin-dependent oxidoreductase